VRVRLKVFGEKTVAEKLSAAEPEPPILGSFGG
jgi:hypothetical protein